MKGFQEMVGEIGVFMICAQAILHFRPKESYGKYLRLLLGVMILVQIFQPFYGLFTGKSDREVTRIMQDFQEILEQNMKEADRRAESTGKMLEDRSLSEIRDRMEQESESEQEVNDIKVDHVEVKEVLP